MRREAARFVRSSARPWRVLLRLWPLPVLLLLGYRDSGMFPGMMAGAGGGPPSPSGALASLHFLGDPRRYPDDDIPAEGYRRAWSRHAAAVAMARSAVGEPVEPDPWRPIGPTNVGGRTNALAIDPRNPQEIWAGSASGGLWRTTTAGIGVSAWTYVDTGYPVLGVNAIAIDTTGNGMIYIGTGEVYSRTESTGGLYIRTTRGSYGIGILTSTDGGSTWSKSLDWEYDWRRGVQALRLDPGRPERVFAGTTEGVYRSLDRGASWVRVLDVPMVVDLAIHPHNGDTLYASCGNLGVPSPAGIYRSVDGGDSWQRLEGGLPPNWTGKTLLDLYPAAPNVVYADISDAFAGVGLYRSTDSGQSWVNLTEPWSGYAGIATYQGWFSHFVAVHPADSSRVVVAGVDVHKSYDGGRSFSRRSYWNKWYQGIVPPQGPEGPPDYAHADHHAFARHPYEPDTIYLATDGGIFVSHDFGETFQGRNGGYQTAQFYAGFTSAPFTSRLALGGLQDNSTVVYHGGPAWERTLGGDGGMTGIYPYDPDILIGSTQYGRLYRSQRNTQGRLVWTRVNRNMETGGGLVAFVAPFVQAAPEYRIAYAGRTRVWRSDDYAQTWYLPGSGQILDGNPVLALAVFPGDPEVVWAATVPDGQRAGVFRSTNGGASWQNVTRDLPNRYPIAMATSYTDAWTAYIVFSGFGTGHLYKTENGGQTWRFIGAGLPDLPTSALAIDPLRHQHLYVGNDFGVWFSPDDGATWRPFATGMPTAALIMDLSISPRSATLRAVTHGLGVWERPLARQIGEGGGAEPEPEGPHLFAGRPNPFSSETQIIYFLPEPGPARLELLNVRGQLVRTLADRSHTAGYHSVVLRADGLASGVYLYRLEASGQMKVGRLLLIR